MLCAGRRVLPVRVEKHKGSENKDFEWAQTPVMTLL